MRKTFKARLSKFIIGFYWLIVIFLLSSMMLIPMFVGSGISNPALFYSVMVLIFLLFALTTVKAYKRVYIVTENEIVIRGVLRKISIKIKDVKSAQRTLIPLGIRLFGFSFLEGYYYFPGLGSAWMSMSNFTDGVMLKTKDKKIYLITPENPNEFLRSIRRR